MSMEDENCTAWFGADEPQRPQARVWLACETTEFDDFRDGRWSMKRPDSGEKYPTSLVYVMVGEIFFLKRTK